jgi:hypothetical protein
MKLKNMLLVAAFSLLTPIIAASGANILITNLPFTIAAPGKYVLNSDLTSSGSPYAITVTVSNVIIDLKGHTLNGDILIQNSYVTVQNETSGGILTGEAGNLSHIDLEKLVVGGIRLNATASTVSNRAPLRALLCQIQALFIEITPLPLRPYSP